MARYEETSRLRTLADAVSGPFGSDSGVGGNGVWDSDPGVKGFDINEASEDGGGGGGGEVGRKLGSPDRAVVKLGAQVSGEVEAAKVLSGNGFSFGSDGKSEEEAVVGEKDAVGGDDGVGEDDGEYTYEHGFSVGDLVWGKIKSHPWWPGQIYDSEHASEYALKFNQKGRLLVAYFGDGSFAWCSPSQLIPFAEHFEDMSKQSTSKTFASAVQEAVDEIGRLVEMEMTCKCVSEENRKGLDAPLSENAGIKAGVCVPEGDLGKILSFRYDSAELLATVESIAESVSFANMLELAILKGWLSALFRARGGGYSLPVFHEGLLIEGLEDKNRTEAMHKNDLIDPIEVPLQGPREEDWASEAVTGPDSGPAPSEDKVYHKRKQKSVAELMREGSDMKFKSSKKKRMVTDETGNQNDGVHASATGRKRGRKKTDEMANGEDVCVQRAEAIHQNPLSSEWKEGETGGSDHKDDEGTKGTEEISSPRERKKSKYLSPPYTNAQFGAGRLSSKKESENESVEISKIPKIGEHVAKRGPGKSSSKEELENESVRTGKIARIGEAMTKAAGILLDTPLIKCNGQTVQEKFALKTKEAGQLDSSIDTNPPRTKQGEKIIETLDVKASPNEVLEGVVHLAASPLYSWDENLLVLIRGFLSTFRSSIYLNGANYKIYCKTQSGRKRKSSSSEQGKVENGDAKSTEAKKSHRSVGKKPNLDNSDTTGKKGAKGSVVKLNEKKVQGKAFPASLVNQKLTAADSSDDTAFPSVGKRVASKPGADERPQLGSVRRKLKTMTSMLEKCDGKCSQKELSNLESEIKHLLDKVGKMIEAASN